MYPGVALLERLEKGCRGYYECFMACSRDDFEDGSENDSETEVEPSVNRVRDYSVVGLMLG